jgi:glycosyltransferase involved in cell wall biosynthesis
MRILFVVHQFMPDFSGGTERVTLNLARAAQADGNRVEVLTITAGDRPGWRADGHGLMTSSIEGVPVTAIRLAEEPLVELGFRPNPGLAAGVQQFLASRPAFHLAHAMHSLRMTEAVEALAAQRIPYVVTVTDFFTLCYRVNLVRLNGELCAGPAGGKACQVHCPQSQLSGPDYGARTRRYGDLLRKASAVVAVSDFVAGRVRAEHPNLRVFTVSNGIDLLAFPRPQAPAAAGPLTLGYLGTVSEAKGALLLAEAFAAAKADGIRLRIVGPCYEPATATRIRALAETAAISLEEPVPAAEVPALLAGFDLLAVPSQVPESFSLSLHEGFAAGLPALVSALGNAGEVVARTGAGLALPAGDLGAWSAAIRDLAARPELLRAWAEAAPLPWRTEEEAFLYAQLYRAAVASA